MNTNTFTESDFYFSDKIENLVKTNSPIYELNYKICNSNIPLFAFIEATLEDYENLMLTVALQERKQDFMVNAYFHLIHLIYDYESENVNYYQAIELAMEEIRQIFNKYNNKDIRPLFD
jgi:ribosome-associated translation inhibitor RaiA